LGRNDDVQVELAEPDLLVARGIVYALDADSDAIDWTFQIEFDRFGQQSR
jgi:hypothetical protein